MLNSKHFLRRVAAGAAVALVTCVLVADANVVRGWFAAGSKPSEFEAGVDVGHAHEGQASAFLKSKQSSVDGFGTLMQSIRAEQYKGKRVRLSGFVNSQEVEGWAGLWMRVDQGKDAIAFDNMQDRPIKGTTGWQRYDVVLDVPSEATGISFGILLAGTGEVWLSGTKFDVVGTYVPVTSPGDNNLPEKPVNLDFTE
jgi:hypothetical protein